MIPFLAALIMLAWPSVPNATGYTLEREDGLFEVAGTACQVEVLFPDKPEKVTLVAWTGPQWSLPYRSITLDPCPQIQSEAVDPLTPQPGAYALTVTASALPGQYIPESASNIHGPWMAQPAVPSIGGTLTVTVELDTPQGFVRFGR